MDLYIYYRVPRAQAQQLQVQVNAMQASLRRDHDVAVALKKRPPQTAKTGADTGADREPLDTWMEVYLAVPDDFENTLRQAFDAAAYAGLIDGTRHIEYFLDCTPCV